MKKITSPQLAALDKISHAFFTKAGAPDNLVTVHQIHSAKAVVVDTPWEKENQPKADALVTKTPGIMLGIKTADCAPVLLADADAGIVAALHAGWRGAFEGIAEETIKTMQSLGARPEKIVAAIGPCIGRDSYEVSAGFETPFLEQDSANAAFFRPAEKEGHLLFDLAGYIASRLGKMGVLVVDHVDEDTFSADTVFFSHRRATLRGTADTEGRQMSAIGLVARPAS